MERLYYPLGDYIRQKFGCRAYKVMLDSGLECPNRDGTIDGEGEGCIYCDPEALKPKVFTPGLTVTAQLALEIEKVKLRHNADKFIAYFQLNTNTSAPVELLEELYNDAAAHPDVVALAISTRPDYLGDDVISLLKSIKRKKHLWVELGLQSAKGETLKLLRRGHTPEDFSSAVLRASGAGIDVCAHVILGLPGESETDALATMSFLAELKIWGVKFHQLQIISGTELEAMFLDGAVTPPTLAEYVELVVRCLELLPPETVIHRLSGDVPKKFLAIPQAGGWDVNKFIIIERILSRIQELKTRQGARLVGV
jgi:hypothetical protein